MKVYKGWIYLYVNKINGKRYIGQTNNIKRRYRDHIKNYNNSNCPIDLAISKYGIDNFEFKIIHCFCTHSIKHREVLLNELETKYIKLFKSYRVDYPNGGYNLTLGGDGQRGFKHTEESKKKMSKAKKGIHMINDGSFKKGVKPWCTGKKLSEEHKQKLSEAHKKQCANPEFRVKISVGLKEYYKNHESKIKGFKHSEETKQRLSEIHKGMPSARSIPIIQYDLEGNFIKEWPSIAKAMHELHLTYIYQACKKGKIAGGYLWKYKEK